MLSLSPCSIKQRIQWEIPVPPRPQTERRISAPGSLCSGTANAHLRQARLGPLKLKCRFRGCRGFNYLALFSIVLAAVGPD